MAKRILILVVFVLIASGCEKIIDIDLNEASPKIVIEAVVNNKPVLQTIRITRSGSYFEECDPEMVHGAEVFITDTLGHKFVFPEYESGIYQSEVFSPAYYCSYQLHVKTGGDEYTAVSTLYPPVKIASASSEYVEGYFFTSGGYVARFSFFDPVKDENYYRLNISGSRDLEGEGDTYYLFDDEFYNGRPIEMTLQGRLYNPGDTIILELITLDKPAYKYLSTLQDILSGNSAASAAPSNPVSNLSGDALGYFSVYSSTKDTVFVEGN